MRHSFSTGQFTLLYSIIVLICKFFECQDICTKPELGHFRKLIFENDAYKYSHHYYYSQTIRSNQPPPVIKGSFETIINFKEIAPRFPFKFYGVKVIVFAIFTSGTIYMFDEKHLGEIDNFMKKHYFMSSQISDHHELLAVRTSYYEKLDDKIPAFNITNMIHPNGKISVYFENVPKVTGENKKTSKILGLIRCGAKGS
ncbi:unnamed protein product [Schistosoma margrebowiei]|uniref:Sema domain-containing protein n=1 Tax=Schistosoma margrebowiei TaxID=48269 RepID=A0AA85AIT0_9TREM|nr:unnamed protein product [Schistosoma margrebowiei]